MTIKLTLRVTNVRSANPFGFGGCIFSGRAIDAQGDTIDAKTLYVVRASSGVIGDVRVEKGQWWNVSGSAVEQTRVVDSFKFQEWQIIPTEASLVRLSGEHIVTFLAESDEFKGVGIVKARRLWERFGDELYRILDEANAELLTELLTKEIADHMIRAWAAHGDSFTLQWMQKNKFDVSMARRVIKFFGRKTVEKIEEDPYRLLSFCGGWNEVDTFARQQLGVSDDDPRRLFAAIEESLYRVFERGHTAGTVSMLEPHLAAILNTSKSRARLRSLIHDAIDAGLNNGSYAIGNDDMLHPLGAMVMEMTVAEAFHRRVCQGDAARLLQSSRVEEIIEAHQATLPFPLTHEQRRAVQTANDNAAAIIVGGAGVGKTTVLQTLYQIYDAADVRVYQVALAGRAAKRMQEATGRNASTIASFLKSIKPEDLQGKTVVVIDEASMVDIITMSSLCERLPDEARLVCTGDPNQLMPVGPGLVLHELVEVSSVPKVELTAVKRYGGDIAKAAAEIRRGHWPSLGENPAADISFISCAPIQMAGVIVDLYDRDPLNTQILTMRKNSADGTKILNELCQQRYTASGRKLTVWSDFHEKDVFTGFNLNDLVICTRNRWDFGIQNGSLGKLVKISDSPMPILDKDGIEIGSSIATIEWDDGCRRPVTEELLNDLNLGYAITIHKAQGSQWPVVIVALSENRLLDRTMIYTAVTRARSKVIIVGDRDAAMRAVKAPPKAHGRRTGLEKMLKGDFAVI